MPHRLDASDPPGFILAGQPATGWDGMPSSFVIQLCEGGFSLSELLSDIEALIEHHDLVLKLRTVVAETFGHDVQAPLGWSFDLTGATASLRMYDMSVIPAIRPPLPAGVAGVRFRPNLQAVDNAARRGSINSHRQSGRC